MAANSQLAANACGGVPLVEVVVRKQACNP